MIPPDKGGLSRFLRRFQGRANQDSGGRSKLSAVSSGTGGWDTAYDIFLRQRNVR